MQGTGISRRLVVEQALGRIRSAGVPADRREVEWLLQAAEGLSRAGFVASLDDPPDEGSFPEFERMVTRRMMHEPVQYILGETEFYGRSFSVTPDVLIPRPETELLVERMIEASRALVAGDGVEDEGGRPERTRSARTAAPRILDAGTGSGCIAVTVALEFPSAACTAFDVSRAALGVARSNAERHGADVRFAVGDMLDDPPDDWRGAFDVLVSNPPYIPDTERADLERQVSFFEPEAALFTGRDALKFYRGLARLGTAVLAPGGLVFLETHADHASAVASVFAGAGYVDVDVQTDLAGRDRIVRARRC